jgi:hypothetical protein
MPGKRILRRFEISEISAVDKPAQDGARALIIKRDGGANMEPNEALLGSIESILEDDEIDGETRNELLIRTVAQYVVGTGANTATARGGAPKAPLASPDIVIAEVVKRVAAGEKSNLSKEFFEGLAKVRAQRDRRAGETPEQALARFHQTPEGRLLREAVKRAPVARKAERAAPTRGPAMRALHKRADELCAADRSLTRAKAVAKIAETREPRDRAIWNAARIEEKGRATA